VIVVGHGRPLPHVSHLAALVSAVITVSLSDVADERAGNLFTGNGPCAPHRA